MKINTVIAGKNEIAEVVSSDILIRNTQDALDVYGTAYLDFIILYDHNFEKDFFDLSTRKLGDVLQKFTNLNVKVAIVGDFDKYPSKTLKDFIYESNKQGKYLFVSSKDEAIQRWSV